MCDLFTYRASEVEEKGLSTCLRLLKVSSKPLSKPNSHSRSVITSPASLASALNQTCLPVCSAASASVSLLLICTGCAQAHWTLCFNLKPDLNFQKDALVLQSLFRHLYYSEMLFRSTVMNMIKWEACFLLRAVCHVGYDRTTGRWGGKRIVLDRLESDSCRLLLVGRRDPMQRRCCIKTIVCMANTQ